MGKYIRWIHWWLAIWSHKQIPTNPYKHFMGCILCIIINCLRQPLLHTCNYFRGRHLIMVDMKLVAGFPYLSWVPAIQRKDESIEGKVDTNHTLNMYISETCLIVSLVNEDCWIYKLSTEILDNDMLSKLLHIIYHLCGEYWCRLFFSRCCVYI